MLIREMMVSVMLFRDGAAWLESTSMPDVHTESSRFDVNITGSPLQRSEDRGIFKRIIGLMSPCCVANRSIEILSSLPLSSSRMTSKAKPSLASSRTRFRLFRLLEISVICARVETLVTMRFAGAS